MARVESYSQAEARQKLRDWISEALPIVSWQFAQIGGLRVPQRYLGSGGNDHQCKGRPEGRTRRAVCHAGVGAVS